MLQFEEIPSNQPHKFLLNHGRLQKFIPYLFFPPHDLSTLESLGYVQIRPIFRRIHFLSRDERRSIIHDRFASTISRRVI